MTAMNNDFDATDFRRRAMLTLAILLTFSLSYQSDANDLKLLLSLPTICQNARIGMNLSIYIYTHTYLHAPVERCLLVTIDINHYNLHPKSQPTHGSKANEENRTHGGID